MLIQINRPILQPTILFLSVVGDDNNMESIGSIHRVAPDGILLVADHGKQTNFVRW